MYTYYAYGLSVTSELRLDLKEVESTHTDVRLFVDLPPPDGRLGEYTSDHVIVTVRDRLTCCIRGGREIRVIPNPRYRDDLEDVVGLVFDVLLAVILQQRGLVVLHAATLHYQGHVVAFLGDRGAGKSTTAAYLTANGFQLLDDDLMVTDITQSPCNVLAGSTRLRLRPSSAEVIGDRFFDLPLAHPYEDKRLLAVDGVTKDVPLHAASLFILKWSDEVIVVKQVSRAEALLALMMNTYIGKLDVIPEQRADSFQRCRQLLEVANVYELKRPRSLNKLPLVLNEVANAIGVPESVPGRIN